MLETLKERLSEATLTQLSLPLGRDLDEEMEEARVLGVNALTVTCYVTAVHFLVSFRTLFHRCSFLRRDTLNRTRPLERSTTFPVPLKEAAG
jgi:hypothetical protein